MGWVRKLTRPDANGNGAVRACDPEWLREFPAIHEWLTDNVDADGRPRRTASLTLFVDGGEFKCFINDRCSGASLCCTGTTIAGLFTALEAVLEEENPPWRWPERPAGKKQGRGQSSS
jgi:hypothetical protein